jgi:3'-5' exonuclease
MNNFFGHLKDILFLDIETASLTRSFEDLPERLQEEWSRKTKFLQEQEGLTAEELFFDKAGIHAEFGKVVCIGVGFFMMDADDNRLIYRTKTFAAEEEHDTLWVFRELLEKKAWTLCGHNGKEFDFPYICRRMLINGIALPEVLQLAGKKPWEIRHLDTMEMWKFGDYKYYTRLELLAAVFDIPSSKEGIDGSMVNHTYYKENNLADIRKYCVRDVEVTARLYLAYHGLPGDLEIEVINLDEAPGD